MTDTNRPTPSPSSTPARRWGRWAAISAAAAASVVALTVWASPGHAGLGGPGGMEGRMMAMHGGGSHGAGGGWLMGRGLDRMLDGVNATEAQRTQIRQIAQSARADLQSQRATHLALRDRAMAAFTATTVDAREVETVRQAMLAQHDAASQRVSQAMLDASRVLTPEQRTQLAERLKQRSEQMRQRHEERQRPGAPQS
jgi:periplasmic protein CpxP/Spy